MLYQRVWAVGGCLVVLAAEAFYGESALGQVQPATDGTGTEVRQRGDRITIDGGSISRDGANLFHSFEAFGLTAEQIATFLTPSTTENVLGRVVGGDASIINGMLRLRGSEANLYLMNPAGIVFGDSARLDVPGSFMATTANAIGFGDRWWDAFDSANYQQLVGDPSTFAFTSPTPGAIVNAGDLAVPPAEQLTLLGGTVINTGTLTAPGGEITVAAVPGEQLVEVSQSGSVLSLALDTAPNTEAIAPLPFQPLDLPALLTHPAVDHATGVEVNGDGTVSLTGSGVTIPSEDGVAIASGTLTTATDQSNTNPEINVLGDRVALLDAELDASAPDGGGLVRVGGDYQGQGTVFNAQQTVVDADSTLTANADLNGDGGQVIVWADGSTQFYGTIQARGGEQSGDGGLVEVSGRESLLYQGVTDVLAANGRTGSLLLDPEFIVITPTGVDPVVGNRLFSDRPTATSRISGATLADAINTADVTLQANRDITVADTVRATTRGNGLTLQAGRSVIFRSSGRLILNGGDFTAQINDENALSPIPGNAQFVMQRGSSIRTAGGDVTITSGGESGNIFLNRASINTASGDITMTAAGIDGAEGVDGRGGDGGSVGIALVNSTLQTTTGNIRLNGTGGDGGRGSTSGGNGGGGGGGGGVFIESSTITSRQGRLSIRGVAGEDGAGTSLGGNGGSAGGGGTGGGSISGGNVGQPGTISGGGRGGDAPSSAGGSGGSGIGAGGGGGGGYYYSGGGGGGGAALGGGGGGGGGYDYGGGGGGGNNNNGGFGGLGDYDDGQNGTANGGDGADNGGGLRGIQGLGGIGGGNSSGGGSGRFGSGGGGGGSYTGIGGGGGGGSFPSITFSGRNRISAARVNIEGDSIDVLNPGNQPQVRASGPLIIQPISPSLPIDISDAADFTNGDVVSRLQLTGQELSQFASETSVVVGRSLSTTGIEVSTNTGLPRDLTLRGGFVILNTPLSLNSFTSTTFTIINGDITTVDDLTMNSISVSEDSVLTSTNGDIAIGTIGSGSDTAPTLQIRSDEGSITLGSIGEGGEGGEGGGASSTFFDELSIEAQDDIRTGNIFNVQNELTLTSSAGNITTEQLNVDANVVISALGDIVTEDIDIFDGTIDMLAGETITLGRVEVVSSAGERDITLRSPGDIQVESIEIRDGSGDIRIVTSNFFRATGFVAESDSSTSGSSSGSDSSALSRARSTSTGALPISLRTADGSITIEHGGGEGTPPVQPFVVGDASVNGTAGSIVADSSSLLAVQSIPGDLVEGRISIDTDDQPGEQPPEVNPPVAVFTFPAPNIEPPPVLSGIIDAAGVRPALVYINFVPADGAIALDVSQLEATNSQDFASYLNQANTADGLAIASADQDDDFLEILLVLPSGDPVRYAFRDITRQEVMQVANQFISQISDPRLTRRTGYLAPAQLLHQWLISPLEGELTEQNIDNLAFVLDSGLRSVPIAALHDGENFLVERYSIGLMPSLSLTDTRYQDLRNSQVLAMGASQFTDQLPLPAVPFELESITSIWDGTTILGEAFTPETLLLSRQQTPYGIVHLATHGEFRAGDLSNSYIQFQNERLPLDRLRELGLNDPPVNLLVLSACRTASGSSDVELGFAGLALQAGVQSALASLWYVSDVGTLGFMTEFYQQLRNAPIKAEAVRQTQLALINGLVRVEEGQLLNTGNRGTELSSALGNTVVEDFSHPYFWAAFTLVGSPW